jgi:tetratricopeptide (TPR) repeat protein
MAAICSSLGRYAAAGFHYDRAIALNPNNIYARISRAQWMTWGGRCEDALAELDIVVHGQSVAPAYGYYWEALGEALFQLRRYQEAIDALGKSKQVKLLDLGFDSSSACPCWAFGGGPSATDGSARIATQDDHRPRTEGFGL